MFGASVTIQNLIERQASSNKSLFNFGLLKKVAQAAQKSCPNAQIRKHFSISVAVAERNGEKKNFFSKRQLAPESRFEENSVPEKLGRSKCVANKLPKNKLVLSQKYFQELFES